MPQRREKNDAKIGSWQRYFGNASMIITIKWYDYQCSHYEFIVWHSGTENASRSVFGSIVAGAVLAIGLFVERARSFHRLTEHIKISASECFYESVLFIVETMWRIHRRENSSGRMPSCARRCNTYAQHTNTRKRKKSKQRKLAKLCRHNSHNILCIEHL